MPAADEHATRTGGRRRKISKGGNRGKWGVVVRRPLWGFGRRRWCGWWAAERCDRL